MHELLVIYVKQRQDIPMQCLQFTVISVSILYFFAIDLQILWIENSKFKEIQQSQMGLTRNSHSIHSLLS